jgi:hypothetical protein
LLINRALSLSKKEWDGVVPNFETIIKPSSCNIIIPSGIINKFLKEYNISSSCKALRFSKESVYLSGKAGPQGPATLTALENIRYFTESDIEFMSGLTDEKGIDFLIEQINYF